MNPLVTRVCALSFETKSIKTDELQVGMIRSMKVCVCVYMYTHASTVCTYNGQVCMFSLIFKYGMIGCSLVGFVATLLKLFLNSEHLLIKGAAGVSGKRIRFRYELVHSTNPQ